MIDLNRTRRGLLAEIGATDMPDEPLTDITDPRVAATDVHVRLCGQGRADLLPLLKVALSERFRTSPNLTPDLLMPLKNALSNAHKHGNGRDPAKVVTVEIVLTRKGTFIAITDQGPGFDAALTFQRFQKQQRYFTNFGNGFRNLHQAKCTVAYENGGRTVLLCYRPIQDSDPYDSTSTPGESTGGDTAPKFLDAGWMQSCFSTEFPEFADGQARLESCRVYEPAGDDCGNRYVLRVGPRDGEPVERRILTGRIHASEGAARADFEAATTLREAKLSKLMRIPAAWLLAAWPRLVLYRFDPWLDLREYLTYRANLRSVRRYVEKFGRALARLHRSGCAFRVVEPDGAERRQMFVRTEAMLQTLPRGPELVDRFGDSIERIQEGSAGGRPQILTPIHGALGWDCIRYGIDGEFYLYRFESCRRSDPRLDLGGFAADLLSFTLAAYDDAAYRLCSNAFLSNYNRKAEHSVFEEDLQPFIVLALCERLQRAESDPKAGVGPLLRALDSALGQKHDQWGSS